MPGIWMSATTTEGCTSRHIVQASLPSLASSTSWPSSSRSVRSMVRTSRSSSATRTGGISLAGTLAGTVLSLLPSSSSSANCIRMSIRRQGLVVPRFPPMNDVRYPVTAAGHLPGDEAAVASKPDDFGAHDGGGRLVEQVFESLEAGAERLTVHVRLVAALAKTAQRLPFPHVPDPAPRQRRLQRLPIELRVPARHRKMPHVDELRHAVVFQQRNELIQGARRMPHGEETVSFAGR